jgi:2-polyprenyl-3-methyl-5-hydroxy-6-metoxy-1,4-benzoquinol methylase
MSEAIAPPPDWERYGTPIDLDEITNSRVVLLGHVGREPQRILELGPSAGLMTSVLAEWGHSVTGIEIDPVAAAIAGRHAVEMVVGDLEDVDDDGRTPLERFAGAEFDALIAADVLEHLREPTNALHAALACVKHDGIVHLSIPNVAHADVRLRLLGGSFDYVENGLMDRTHIQMFTIERLVEMIRSVGLTPIRFHRAVQPVGFSEVPVDENLVEFGRRLFAGDPDAETYQWVVACQRAEVVGDDADWPDVSTQQPVIERALEMMNAPVAPHPHPSSNAVVPIGAESRAASVRRRLSRVRRMVRSFAGR